MFMNSNGIVIQCRTPYIVHTMEICNVEVHYGPSPSSEGKPSTTLTNKRTEGRCGEVLVEKHAPQHVISKTHCKQRNVQTKCAYSDLALTAGQGDSDANSNIDKRDEMSMDNQCRFKVIQTEQRTVGHQVPQELKNLITGQDNDNGEATAQGKQPWKPPDQSNDASHHLGPLNTVVHWIDDSPVGELNNLIVE